MKMNLVLILVVLTLGMQSYAQDYSLINKNESIHISILNDSLILEIKNESDKVIFLPIENALTQNCSDNGRMYKINLGLDLQVFNERGRFELEELMPKSSRIIKTKLIKCQNDGIVKFEFQFYMRKVTNKKNTKPICNTDFLKDRDWLSKGDWEWGELYINRKLK